MTQNALSHRVRTAAILFLLSFTLPLALPGCSTKVMDPSIAVDETNNPDLSPLRMQVVLSDSSGLRLPGVLVTAHSGKATVTSETDRSGSVLFTIPYRANARVDFKFKSSEFNWSESVFEIPTGVTAVTLHFVADVTGKVRFSHLQY